RECPEPAWLDHCWVGLQLWVCRVDDPVDRSRRQGRLVAWKDMALFPSGQPVRADIGFLLRGGPGDVSEHSQATIPGSLRTVDADSICDPDAGDLPGQRDSHAAAYSGQLLAADSCFDSDSGIRRMPDELWDRVRVPVERRYSDGCRGNLGWAVWAIGIR